MSKEETIVMTPAQLDAMLEKVIERTLTRYGVDTKNPLDQQKDMQHLRSWRIASENSFLTARNVVIVALTTGVLGTLGTLFFNLPTKGS